MPGRHELGRISETALGGSGRNRFLYGRGCPVAGLFVLLLNTRRMYIEGITLHATDAFMTQSAHQLTEPIDGFLLGKRHLLLDWGEKFVHGFDSMLHASGVNRVVLLPRSPNHHASARGSPARSKTQRSIR